MPLIVNLRHMENHSLTLEGELAVGELDLDLRDDLIRADDPLHYSVVAELLPNGLLLQGRLRLPLKCLCVRCLKPVELALELNNWTQLLPLSGDEKVEVTADCVDLTPILREDILLEFPQHPLCEAGCRGLPKPAAGKAKPTSDAASLKKAASAWAALDKLKLNN